MKRSIFMLTLLGITLATGCSDKEQTEEPAVEIEENEVEKDIIVAEAEEVLPFVTPFTGERVAEEVTMRPILATINNHPQARPQSGLAQADVVYEIFGGR